MSKEENEKKNKEKTKINVKEKILSMEEYHGIYKNTPEENRGDLEAALNYYSSQWQNILDVFTNAVEDEEIKKAFRKELQNRFGKK